MTTSGNNSNRGVNVRGGGASLGNFTTQAIPQNTQQQLSAISGFNQRILQTNNPIVANHPWGVIIPPLTTTQQPNNDTLTISHLQINNGQFTPVNNNGISNIRPEIISLLDFKPIYKDESHEFNDVGKLLDIQYQATILRQNTLLNIVNNIRANPTTTNDLNSIQDDFLSKFNSLNELVDFYKNTIDTLELLKESLDIKNIKDSSFNTKLFLTLRGLYESPFMSFPVNSFDKFTNTKILYQLLFDFKSIIQNYSFNLLNLNDPIRTNDIDPIHIDKSYTNINGFSFTYDTIKSSGTTAVNAAGQIFFNHFQNSLPAISSDRLKLLTTILAKELRVSSGLSDPGISQILRVEFNITPAATPTLFDRLIGVPGNTILEPPSVVAGGGGGVLSSLLFLDLNSNSFALPFEKKYIDDTNSQKIYVPGANFFIDSILNITNNQFNTSPFTDYIQDFSSTFTSVSELIEGLFKISDTQSSLASVSIYDRFLTAFLDSMSGTGIGSQIKRQNIVALSLFRLANTDVQLKRMLFQYLLLLCLKTQFTIFGSNLRFIFLHIINEINDLTGLDFVRLDSNENPTLENSRNVQPFLDQLATDIQQRVYEIIQVSPRGGNQPIPHPTDPSAPHSQRDNTDRLQGESTQNPPPSDAELNGQIIEFDVDSISSITDALHHTENTLFEGFTQVAYALDVAANNYTDSNGRTNFNNLSATTLLLIIYEIFCNIADKFVVCDFSKTLASDGTVTMTNNKEANQILIEILRDVISETDTIITPNEIGNITTNDDINTSGVSLSTGQQSAVSDSTNLSYVTNISSNTTTLGDASRNRSSLNTSRIASSTGQGQGTVQNSINNNAPFIGGENTTARTGTNINALIAQSSISNVNSDFLSDMVNLQIDVFSIKTKVYEEDLIIANILHVLGVIYQNLSVAKDRMLNYFTPSKLNDFLIQSRTDINDINKILNLAQIKIIVSSRDRTAKQLTQSGRIIGRPFGFVSTVNSDANTMLAIGSLLDQPEYRETSLADRKIKILTVGIPQGFTKNLVDRVNALNPLGKSFSDDKEIDIIELLVYKRNLEHQELVFKPKKFIFDLSLFDYGYEGLNILPTQDFNSILTNIKLADYQKINNPIFPQQFGLDVNDKYSFLTSDERHSIFNNHVTSNILSSYITYLTAMNFMEEIFVDTTSTTFKTNNTRGANDLSTEVQSKIIRYLNVVQHKNLPSQTISSLLQNSSIDQDTKDTLRLVSFGNLVFKSDAYMTRLLSPKLFDRVFTLPINVDEFQIDLDMTLSTMSGKEYLTKLYTNATQYLKTDSDGNLYLKPRNKEDVIFEDYFVTIDLVK